MLNVNAKRFFADARFSVTFYLQGSITIIIV